MTRLTTSQAAKQLNTTTAEVARMCRDGQLPNAQKDERGHWQIPQSDLNALLPDQPAPPTFNPETWWQRFKARPAIWLTISIITLIAGTAAFFGSIAGFGADAPQTIQNIQERYPQLTNIPYEPEQEGETLIIIFQFEHTPGVTDTDAAGQIERQINQILETQNANIRVQTNNTIIPADNRERAETLAARSNASIIIWGTVTGGTITTNFLNTRADENEFVQIYENQRVELAGIPEYTEFLSTDLPSQISFLSLYAVTQSLINTDQDTKALESIQIAIAQLDNVQKPPSGTEVAYFTQGLLHHYSFQYIKAIESYSYAINLDEEDTIEDIPAYLNRGDAYRTLGETTKASSDFQSALRIAENNNDLGSEALAHSDIGKIYETQGYLKQAEQHFLIALELFEKVGEKSWIAGTHTNLGLVLLDQGHVTQAKEHVLTSLELFAEINNTSGMGSAYGNLGLISFRQGELKIAEEHFQNSLDLFTVLDDPNGMAIGYNNLGHMFSLQGDYSKAQEYILIADDLYKSIGDIRGQGFVSINLGFVYEAQSDFQNAEQHYLNAVDVFTNIGDLNSLAVSRTNLGHIYTSLRNLTSAEEQFLISLQLHEKSGNIDGQATSHGNLGNIKRLTGNLAEAEVHYLVAADLFSNVNNLEGQASAYANLGLLSAQENDIEKARIAWEFSTSLYERSGNQIMANEIISWLSELDE